MRTRTRRSFASYAVLVVLLVGLTGPAVAASAPVLGLTVDRSTVRSGQTVTATATSDAACAWTISWNGELRRGTGTVLRATFTAPAVKKRTALPLRAACYPVPAQHDRRAARKPTTGTTGPSQRITVTVPAAQRRALTITVLPRRTAVQPPDDGGNGNGTGGGDLPGTGGPDRDVLLAALGAVLAGLLLILAGTRGRRDPDPA